MPSRGQNPHPNPSPTGKGYAIRGNVIELELRRYPRSSGAAARACEAAGNSPLGGVRFAGPDIPCNYAPTLAVLSLMGLDPRLVFPIMAVGASLAGTAASVRHLASKRIDLSLATGMTLGAIPAVLVAAFLVKEMPTEVLRWLVAVVVTYASIVMLRSAVIERKKAAQA